MKRFLFGSFISGLMIITAALNVYGQDYRIITFSEMHNSSAGWDINDNGQVVWHRFVEGGVHGHKQIFTHDGRNQIQLTDNQFDDEEPRINNFGQMALRRHDGGNYYIILYNGSGETQLTSDADPYRTPLINNLGHVVWLQNDGDYDVFLYNGSDSIPLTNNDHDDERPQINNQGYVVWQGFDGNDLEIFLYNGSTTVQLTNNNTDDEDPKVNDKGYIVWTNTDGVDSEIILHNGTDVVWETNNSYTNYSPQINEKNWVVWRRSTGGMGTGEIFLYDGSDEIQITDNDYDDRNPQINKQGHVVWLADNIDEFSPIFFYNGMDTFQVTEESDTEKFRDPRISDNGYIVWTRVINATLHQNISLAIPEHQWAATFGTLFDEQATSVQITPDRGYVVAGYSSSEAMGGNRDGWIIKLDAAGNVEWQKSYGGNENDVIHFVQNDPDGGYIVAGETGPLGSSDGWVFKIDSSGELEWQKFYEGVGCRAIEVTTGGHYMVGGTTSSSGAGEWDISLMKLDTGGAVLWHKTYGGEQGDYFSSFQRTQDEGYIIAGETASFDMGNGDFWVLKVDADGIIEWEKAYGLNSFVPPDHWNENAESSPHIDQTDDGGYILAGRTTPPMVNNMTWVLKLASDGSVTWQKLFEGKRDQSSVQQTEDDGYILSGGESNGWLMKLDQSGAVEWNGSYGAELSDEISMARQSPDGGFVAVGTTESLAVGGVDMWVLKLDANGEIQDCDSVQTWTGGVARDTSRVSIDSTSTVMDGMASALGGSGICIDIEVLTGNGCTRAIADLVDIARTGQVTPYYPGDDGAIQAGVVWPSPRFTDNEDGTITDNLTGLMWLKDANCAGAIGHDPNETGNGSMNWKSGLDFVAGINSSSHDISGCASYTREYTDWRMPNSNEIETLINVEAIDLAGWLNGQGFENTQSGYYWSSTTWRFGSDRSLAADLSTWRLFERRKDGTFFIWPVRAGQQNDSDTDYPANIIKTGQRVSYHPGDDGDLQWGVVWPSRRFLDHGDGTVTDTLTGLMWLKDGFCFGLPNWSTALDRMADFNINPGDYPCVDYTATYSDWRMPNRKELLSLTDRSKYWNSIPPTDHPFQNLFSWSGHPYIWMSNTNPTNSLLTWTFSNWGEFHYNLNKYTYGASLWPVRGGIYDAPLRDADFDGDGDVDGEDLAMLAAAFGSQRGDDNFDERMDLVSDGIIDEADLQAFAQHFGRTG